MARFASWTSAWRTRHRQAGPVRLRPKLSFEEVVRRGTPESWVFAAPDSTAQDSFSKMSEFDNNPFAAPDSDNPFNVSAAVFSPSVEAVRRARKPAVNSQPTRQETCWVGVGEGSTAGLLNAIRRRRRDWQRSSQSAGVVRERGRGSSLPRSVSGS